MHFMLSIVYSVQESVECILQSELVLLASNISTSHTILHVQHCSSNMVSIGIMVSGPQA